MRHNRVNTIQLHIILLIRYPLYGIAYPVFLTRYMRDSGTNEEELVDVDNVRQDLSVSNVGHYVEPQRRLVV